MDMLKEAKSEGSKGKSFLEQLANEDETFTKSPALKNWDEERNDFNSRHAGAAAAPPSSGAVSAV